VARLSFKQKLESLLLPSLASRSSLQVTCEGFRLDLSASLIWYVKPVKLARCMQILPNFDSRASKPLQLVHSDVHGPVKCLHIKGIAIGSHLSMTTLASRLFICSRRNLRHCCFQAVQVLAEKLTGAKLGTLRDDKGGEYMSTEFEAFCIDQGIQRQHSVRNRPQQNGVAERANRTMEEG